MDCSHVREHLSDYIDESLEAKTKALVEEHLSACKDCRQEVASLRMLISDLGSIETVAPPKDFLDQLHQRMERHSGFSKILDTLSIPMRTKLPMKLAGAVVMAILVFAIFRIQEDQYDTKIVPIVQEPTQSESLPPRMAKAPLETGAREDTYSSRALREKAEPKLQGVQVVAERSEAKRFPDNGVKKIARIETKTDSASPEGAWTELSPTKTAPLMKESIQSESSPPRLAKAVPLATGTQAQADNTGMQAVLQKDEVKSVSNNAVKRITLTETKADHPSRKGGPIELSLVIERERQPDIIRTASDMEAPQAQETKMRGRVTMGEPIPTTQLEIEISIEHLLSRLNEVVERAGGEVVSVEYEKGTHIPQSVCVEIPAEKIDIFQSALQALGELHGSPSGPLEEDEEVLPIRIRLITP